MLMNIKWDSVIVQMNKDINYTRAILVTPFN